MPSYRLNDPRHPVSRCRLMHRALLRLQERGQLAPGRILTPEELEDCIQITTGVTATRAIYDYRRWMLKMRMLKEHPREGVSLLPLEGTITPFAPPTADA